MTLAMTPETWRSLRSDLPVPGFAARGGGGGCGRRSWPGVRDDDMVMEGELSDHGVVQGGQSVRARHSPYRIHCWNDSCNGSTH
jgi:hypothetical protein